MNTSRIQWISSYKTSIVLLLVYAFGLAGATFIEKYGGTDLAKNMVYYSPIFILLQLLMVLNYLAIEHKRQYIRQKRWGV